MADGFPATLGSIANEAAAPMTPAGCTKRFRPVFPSSPKPVECTAFTAVAKSLANESRLACVCVMSVSRASRMPPSVPVVTFLVMSAVDPPGRVTVNCRFWFASLATETLEAEVPVTSAVPDVKMVMPDGSSTIDAPIAVLTLLASASR